MAEEYQITIQVEEPQTPAKPANNPTILHFGDKCEAIIVQEDSCSWNQCCQQKWDEMDRMQRTESNNF